MSIPNLHEYAILNAQVAALKLKIGKPYDELPNRTALAALAKHGGLYTFLDQSMMTARLTAMNAAQADDSKNDKTAQKKMLTVDAAAKLRAMAQNFFYKLINKDGYLIHSELMAYISEPGIGNGVAYNLETDLNPSPTIPAAFTFVGQFIDHDLTLNGINLTEDEKGQVVQDKASPLIDLDSVYGLQLKDAFPQKKKLQDDSLPVTTPQDDPCQKELVIDTNSDKFTKFKDIFDKFFDDDGKFRLNPVKSKGKTVGYDLCREEDDAGNFQAIIFDPRNDENQLILQIHILVERFHNALIESKAITPESCGYDLKKPLDLIKFVELVRKEVVNTWQHFVLTDYMREIIRKDELEYVVVQINAPANSPAHPETQYGKLKHKPYKDLVTGRNVVRMPHEFAIGFRFGHSQLRPFYKLRTDSTVTLFTNARQATPNDLRGGRKLASDHVIDWDVFYPSNLTDETKSLKIDHKVTERVFNLPESAIPDDIKYIGNLAHRNLIRSSQIGIVWGEELAKFYGYGKGDILTPVQILNNSEKAGDDKDDSTNQDVINLFKMDPSADEQNLETEKRLFKTPLWYYVIKEGEIHSEIFPIKTPDGKNRNQLGKAGSRLIAEVLAGALYYGNDFPFDNTWVSAVHKSKGIMPNPQTFGAGKEAVTVADSFMLREIIEFVKNTSAKQAGCKKIK